MFVFHGLYQGCRHDDGRGHNDVITLTNIQQEQKKKRREPAAFESAAIQGFFFLLFVLCVRVGFFFPTACYYVCLRQPHPV